MAHVVDQVLGNYFILEKDKAETTRLLRVSVLEDHSVFDLTELGEMLHEVMRLEFEVKAADKDLGLGVLEHIVLLLTRSTLTSRELLAAVVHFSFIAVFLLNNHVRIRLVDVYHGVLLGSLKLLARSILITEVAVDRLVHVLRHVLAATAPVVVHLAGHLTSAVHARMTSSNDSHLLARVLLVVVRRLHVHDFIVDEVTASHVHLNEFLLDLLRRLH